MFFMKFLTLTLPLQIPTFVNALVPQWREVARFGPGGYLESIVVRPNGDLLTTHSFVDPGVWTVKNPATSGATTSALVAPIDTIAVLWGIAEVKGLEDETWLVIGGNFSSFEPTTAIPGTAKAFKLVFPRDGGEPVIEEAADISSALAPNGLTADPSCKSGVLIADSLIGSIAYLDVASKKFDQRAITYPEMSPQPDTRSVLGVGSVKLHKDHLYFSNAALASIYRVPVDSKGKPSLAVTPELVADVSSLVPGVDDFVFDGNGGIYCTTNTPGNALVHIDTRTGESRIILSGQQLADCSSLAFGRGTDDKNVLYISRGRLFDDSSASASVVAVDLGERD